MSSSEGHLRSIVVGVDPQDLIGEFGLADHLDVVASASSAGGRG